MSPFSSFSSPSSSSSPEEEACDSRYVMDWVFSLPWVLVFHLFISLFRCLFIRLFVMLCILSVSSKPRKTELFLCYQFRFIRFWLYNSLPIHLSTHLLMHLLSIHLSCLLHRVKALSVYIKLFTTLVPSQAPNITSPDERCHTRGGPYSIHPRPMGMTPGESVLVCVYGVLIGSRCRGSYFGGLV